MDGFEKLLDFEKMQKDWSDSAREASSEARKSGGRQEFQKGSSNEFKPGEKDTTAHTSGPSKEFLKEYSDKSPEGQKAFESKYSASHRDINGTPAPGSSSHYTHKETGKEFLVTRYQKGEGTHHVAEHGRMHGRMWVSREK